MSAYPQDLATRRMIMSDVLDGLYSSRNPQVAPVIGRDPRWRCWSCAGQLAWDTRRRNRMGQRR